MKVIKSFLKNFLLFLKRNKEGALAGGAVGVALFAYVKGQGINLMAAASSKGLLDVIMSRSTPLQVADAKVATVCILMGILVGTIIDAIWKPKK